MSLYSCDDFGSRYCMNYKLESKTESPIMMLEESVYEDGTKRICIEETCSDRGGYINEDMELRQYYNHYKHRNISKNEVMERIKVLKCNFCCDSKGRENLFSELDGIYKEINQIVHYFESFIIDLQNDVYHYFEEVKSSYADEEYEKAREKIFSGFTYLNVTSVLMKADKYKKINYPYQEYPHQKLAKIRQPFYELCAETKCNLENAMYHFKEESIDTIKILDFLRVHISNELKFSKYLTSKVYQVSEDCKTLRRGPEIDLNSSITTSSMSCKEIGAIALVEKALNSQSSEVTFLIKKAPESSLLIGVIDLSVAESSQFTNCVSKGYFMSSFGLLMQIGENNQTNELRQPPVKHANWFFNEGDQITMRLTKNRLEFTKKGEYIFDYHASIRIIAGKVDNLYPVIEIDGESGVIQIKNCPQ